MYSCILGELDISPTAKINMARIRNTEFWVNRVRAIPIEHTKKPATIVVKGLNFSIKVEIMSWKMTIKNASKLMSFSGNIMPSSVPSFSANQGQKL